MSNAYANEIVRAANEKRQRANERRARHIAIGRNVAEKPKIGAYNTRELVTEITAAMNRNEAATGQRVCHINNKWQLQVRGKDLRRVLKAMPRVRQEGRRLIEAPV